MIVKKYEGSERDVAILQGLLGHPNSTAEVRSKIELQIKQLRAGASGEKQVAHLLDFELADSKNWIVIHDLRIEIGDKVAQIDHILIGRLFDVWVCESKSFANGVTINEHGEVLTFYDRRPHGIPSPIQQNARHIQALEALMASGVIPLPKRLGFTIQPKFQSLVLIARGSIRRPKVPFPGI